MGALERLEALGNRLPDPLFLFAGMAGIIALASALLAGLTVENPATHANVTVVSLMTFDGGRRMITEAVKNFTGFPPLGTVLVAMLGIGVAERVGLVASALRGMVASVPPALLTTALVFAGIESSLAADAGFVVLVPLGATLYASVGRHPLAGMTVAYASVSGGYGANLLITALDPLLAGLSTAAAHLVDPSVTVLATCNWYFNAVSVVLLTITATVIARWTEPAFGEWKVPPPVSEVVTEGRGLRAAGLAVAAYLLVVGIAAPFVLYNGSWTPLYASMVMLVSAGFFLPGVAYGMTIGRIRETRDVAELAAEAMAGMGSYIVLAFAAAQFVAWFGWSNLGLVLAVHGAQLLHGFGPLPLTLAMIVVSGVVNVIIASASAKWAIMAPVFVPMMMLLGVPPDLTQAAYRIGDAVTNIVTPLLPYVPIVLATARRYRPDAGMGTVLAAQVPYAIVFGVLWTLMLLGWTAMGWPLGPG